MSGSRGFGCGVTSLRRLSGGFQKTQSENSCLAFLVAWLKVLLLDILPTMRRKIGNVLTGASTVAFVVIAIVWGHSVGRWDSCVFERSAQLVHVQASNGTMCVTSYSGVIERQKPLPESGWRQGWHSGSTEYWAFLGWARAFSGNGYKAGSCGMVFAGGGDTRTIVGQYWELEFPIWPLCLATAILPAVRLIRWRINRRRRQTGTCPTCGYDLRATPERCPECGRTSSSATL
jgi:hypothetical protein